MRQQFADSFPTIQRLRVARMLVLEGHAPSALSVQCCRVLTVTRYNKNTLRISRLRRQRCGLTAQRDMRSKRPHSGSDCFVECCARAIPLLFPLCPLPVGPMHLTMVLFRTLKWAARSLSRARERMQMGVGLLGQGHTPHSRLAMA